MVTEANATRSLDFKSLIFDSSKNWQQIKQTKQTKNNIKQTIISYMSRQYECQFMLPVTTTKIGKKLKNAHFVEVNKMFRPSHR